MNRITAFILDLIFPNRCPVCDDIIKFDSFVCDNCIEKLKNETVYEDKICCKCGRAKCVCDEEKIFYSFVKTVFYYDNTARKGILSLKDGSKNFGYFLGDALADKINNDDILKNADFIVPVPASKKRLRERRYNQAYVIAKEISDKTGIPILKNALFKHNSKIQHELNRQERRENVSSFYKSDIDLSGKKIILCDDVMTTGSTLNKCSELLINMGAAEVYAAAGTTTKLKKE